MKGYSVRIPSLELFVPSGKFESEYALKEFALEYCRGEILERLIVEPFIPSDNAVDEDDVIMTTETNVKLLPLSEEHRITASSSLQLDKKLQLLNTIAHVQRQFFHSESPKIIFGVLLDALLDLMDSEYGFIGEMKFEEDGTEYLQSHAVTNLAWDQATQQFYDDNIDQGLKFYNMETLFGAVVKTKRFVIANHPKTDSRAGGVPKGHPPLNHFLGIPFFMPGGTMNGMVGISNKPGGYSEEDIEFLEPFTVTCGNLINAFCQIKENRYLINTLEDSVRKRTHELEQANVELAEANRMVHHTNQLQLQHFASMSHEIRTPLNCVIGISSVLRESKLSLFQQESVDMIIRSGDLLLAIVNDVLDYSKLETDNVIVNVQKSNLQESLDFVIQSMGSKAYETQTFASNFDVLLPEFIHMDSRRVQQILFNLLGNAVKFSPINGTIEFSVQLITLSDGGSCSRRSHSDASDVGSVGESSCPIKPSSMPEESPNGENGSTPFITRCPFYRSRLEVEKSLDVPSVPIRVLRFVVKDNGKGIDQKDLKRIFQPFQQASTTTESVYGGTGLGLSITQKIVTALGGTISVESEKGSWSQFTVDLPCIDTPVQVSDICARVEPWRVYLVGFAAAERSKAMEILSAYQMNVCNVNSMSEIPSPTSEVTTVLLVHEDCFESSRMAALASDSTTLFTFGPKFSVSESFTAHHFRSFDHLIPSVFLQKLIRFVDKEKTASLTPTEPMNVDNAAVSSMDFGGTEPEDNMDLGYTQLRVLIVEDNLVNQKVLSRMLHRLKVQHVDIVNNGLEACEKEAEVHYDLILMDQQMPVMGGLEACRRITLRPREQNSVRPQIVFVTAHVLASVEAECVQAGGSGFVPKPFKLEEIEACLRNVRRSSRPTVQPAC